MAQPEQSFKNHTRLVPLYHYFVLGVLVLNLVQTIIRVVRGPSYDTVLGVLVALALIVLALFSRIFALRAQDRVIRLEMRLRMQRLLPPELQSRIGDFTPRQLIAM